MKDKMTFDEEIDAIAYAMAEAYKRNNNRENACIDVANKFPKSDQYTRRIMWDAIDAYRESFAE